jgi:hypothetical protein
VPQTGRWNEGPLGPNKVAMQIIYLFVWKERMTNWMFMLRAWKVTNAFYEGASLYNHDQIANYKKTLEDWNSKKLADAKQYEYSGRPKLPMRMTKAERLLLIEDINFVRRQT